MSFILINRYFKGDLCTSLINKKGCSQKDWLQKAILLYKQIPWVYFRHKTTMKGQLIFVMIAAFTAVAGRFYMI